ncbi:SDR family NAD(P)-dependent oxidoreductase [Chloroflexota bacterium]
MKLSGKVAIVTGSGAGLGKAMVMLMAREGASVVVNDINPEGIESVVNEIKKEGGVAIGCKADVSIIAEVQQLVKTAVDEFKQIHILVNNAGIRRHSPLVGMSQEDWDAVMNVDLKGAFNCIQAVAGYMMQQKYGKIINIASMAASGSSPHFGSNVNYAVAKSGLVRLTKEAARELGPYGININSISPGFVLTPGTHSRRTEEEVRLHVEHRTKLSVLNRAGTPEDIAKLALFLASDDSSFITAQDIRCDGGRTDLN